MNAPLTSNLVSSLREGDRVLRAAAPLTYDDAMLARAADEIELLRTTLQRVKDALARLSEDIACTVAVSEEKKDG